MNKTGLMILLLLSAVLVLYPSITALIDAQTAIGRSGSVPAELLKIRDNAIMQMIGLILLYVFLYFFLNSYLGKQTIQQVKPSADNQPTQQVNLTSKRINPEWSIVIGMLAGIGISVWKLISDIPYSGSPDFGSVITYGVIAGFVVGIGCYFLFKHIVEVER